MSSREQHVLVTGGCGYVGSVLVPHLLDAGYRVSVYDIGYFGWAHMPAHPRLRIKIADIRDTETLSFAMMGCDAVIHLACISNDASFELDEALGRTVNFECFEPMVVAAKNAGVKRFIYASTSSVYGVSDQPDVREDHPLVPLTDYNKYKGMCEPFLFKHQAEDFTCTVIRPATVCGYSPRQRLDLSVNILTNHAVTNRHIKVFGGTQMRPNLHIEDMCALYMLLLEVPKEKIAGQIFNVGNENLRISDIANIVKSMVAVFGHDERPITVETTASDDLRSYHINSDKIADALGFTPMRTVAMAVGDLCEAFARGSIPNSMDDDRYYNVRTMKRGGAK